MDDELQAAVYDLVWQAELTADLLEHEGYTLRARDLRRAAQRLELEAL